MLLEVSLFSARSRTTSMSTKIVPCRPPAAKVGYYVRKASRQLRCDGFQPGNDCSGMVSAGQYYVQSAVSRRFALRFCAICSQERFGIVLPVPIRSEPIPRLIVCAASGGEASDIVWSTRLGHFMRVCPNGVVLGHKVKSIVRRVGL